MTTSAGEFLRTRVFAPGASSRWDHLIEHATGAPLTSRGASTRELAS